MAIRIEAHGKSPVKRKYAVEFKCSRCGCEFWVDADSLGEFRVRDCDKLVYNCPECASRSHPVDIMENKRIFSKHKWESIFWQLVESPGFRYLRICKKEE